MDNFQDRGSGPKNSQIRIRFDLRGWIRIRFVLSGWIRIRSISNRIRNPGLEYDMHIHTYTNYTLLSCQQITDGMDYSRGGGGRLPEHLSLKKTFRSKSLQSKRYFLFVCSALSRNSILNLLNYLYMCRISISHPFPYSLTLSLTLPSYGIK